MDLSLVIEINNVQEMQYRRLSVEHVVVGSPGGRLRVDVFRWEIERCLRRSTTVVASNSSVPHHCQYHSSGSSTRIRKYSIQI